MLAGVIFDLDGTLVDTEGYWAMAEREVFGALGVSISSDMAKITRAMSTTEVAKFWYKHSPWEGMSLPEVEQAVMESVKSHIHRDGVLMDGALNILEFFKALGYKIALSTNSPKSVIATVFDKFGLGRYFDYVASAEDELHAKPDPAVYLSALGGLKLGASRCIAFEDSLSGMLSAKGAGIKTVGVAKQFHQDSQEFTHADLLLGSLSLFNEGHLRQLAGRV